MLQLCRSTQFFNAGNIIKPFLFHIVCKHTNTNYVLNKSVFVKHYNRTFVLDKYVISMREINLIIRYDNQINRQGFQKNGKGKPFSVISLPT